MKIYENMIKESKEEMVKDNPTVIDQLQERITSLEDQVKVLTEKLG